MASVPVSLKQPFIKAVRKVFALVSFDPSRCGLSPKKAFEALGPQVKAFLDIEMSILGQMKDDVILACGNSRPVEYYGEFSNVPEEKKILSKVRDMLKRL